MLGMAGLMLLALLGVYFYLRSIGIVPRADYDTEAPVLPAFTRPAVLVLNKTNGFVHEAGIPAADGMGSRRRSPTAAAAASSWARARSSAASSRTA